MTVSGIITIAIGATIVSSMLLFIKGNDRAAAKVRGNVQLAIFFDAHEVPADVQAVQRSLDELKRSGEVKNYQYLDHKAAFAEAKKLFQADPDALLDVTPNDLPVNFHVSLRDAESGGERRPTIQWPAGCQRSHHPGPLHRTVLPRREPDARRS